MTSAYSDPVSVLQAGLAASWARQARWQPASVVHHIGGIQVVLSGVPDQTQQVAVVEDRVADPEAATIAAELLFDRAGWRPAFDLVAGVHPELEAVLVDRGFEVVVSRPGMLCDLSRRAPVAGSPEKLVVESATRRDRAGIVTVQQDAFDLSVDTAFAMVPEAMFTDPTAVVLVARTQPTQGVGGRWVGGERVGGEQVGGERVGGEQVGGEVVGSVTVHLDGRIGAIVGVAVASTARRRGIGTALTVAGLDIARAHGVEMLWLQATPDAEALYESVGFVSVGSCQVWLR